MPNGALVNPGPLKLTLLVVKRFHGPDTYQAFEPQSITPIGYCPFNVRFGSDISSKLTVVDEEASVTVTVALAVLLSSLDSATASCPSTNAHNVCVLADSAPGKTSPSTTVASPGPSRLTARCATKAMSLGRGGRPRSAKTWMSKVSPGPASPSPWLSTLKVRCDGTAVVPSVARNWVMVRS